MSAVTRTGEIVVEIDVDGAREVTGVVRRTAGIGLAEIPADVADPECGIAGLDPREELRS